MTNGNNVTRSRIVDYERKKKWNSPEFLVRVRDICNDICICIYPRNVVQSVDRGKQETIDLEMCTCNLDIERKKKNFYNCYSSASLMHLMYLEWTHVHTCYAMYHKRKNVKKITIFIALFRKNRRVEYFFNYVSLAINFPPAVPRKI